MRFQATSPQSPPARRRILVLLTALPLAALAGCAGDAAPATPPPLRQSWTVMGTTLEISAWDADTARARAGMAAARAAVFRVDTLMSLWLPASDLSAVNRRAGTDTLTVVDPETAAVLQAALEWAARSDGAFDPTVGPLVDVWGFYTGQGRLPPPSVLDAARALVGWEQVAFDPADHTVRLPAAGMRLDLGGIAKGWAVDRCAAVLEEAGVPTAMVDLGGNVRAYGAPPARDHWRVGVRDPRRTSELLAVLEVTGGAVATSGDYERFFVHEGVRYAHILDPRTGTPARGTAGTTAVAATGLEADVLSTVLFLLGPVAGCRVLAEVAGAGAVWVADPDPAGATADPRILPRHVVVSPGLAERLTWMGGGSGGDMRRCPD
ncbi:MAG: FAD:protein FMN transferase [Gemmatimonadota bacterium]